MADEKKTVETDETAGKAKHFATTPDEKTETEVKAEVEVKPDETEKPEEPKADSGTDGKKHHGKTIALVIVIILAIFLACTGGYMLWKSQQPVSDPGAIIQSYDGKTTEEIQDELNRQAEESRMTISVAPKVRIKDGKARVNVINANDNKFDQTFTLEQGGKDVYKSGIIKVGEKVEWCDAADLKTGTATITVQAVDKESGKPSGNPQSVSVEVVNDADSEE